mmetsp:Transcript_13596/g.31745  ORF Transcript_13596/g.31745 Transcript_13596/m.31745 type:complete len:898 (-) Transcript_13596:26-2719(-)
MKELGKQSSHSVLKQAVAAETALLAEIGEKTGASVGELDESGLSIMEPDWEVKIKKTTNQQINDILQQAAIEESRRGRKGIDWNDNLKQKAKRIARLYNSSFNDRYVQHEVVRPSALPELKVQARRTKWNQSHLDQALARLAKIAAAYRPEKTPGLKACLQKELTINDFKDILFRNFRLKLPLPHLVALFTYMDKDSSNTISYVEFLVAFTRMSLKEKEDERDRVLNENKLIMSKVQRREAEFQEKFAAATKFDLPDEFTAAELQSALEKVSRAATYYYNQRGQMLRTFENQGSLDPTAFAEQLRLNFNVRATHGELKAMLAVFDRDGNGSIDMTEFLWGFFGMAEFDPLMMLGESGGEGREDDDDRTFNTRGTGVTNSTSRAMARAVAECAAEAVSPRTAKSMRKKKKDSRKERADSEDDHSVQSVHSEVSDVYGFGGGGGGGKKRPRPSVVHPVKKRIPESQIRHARGGAAILRNALDGAPREGKGKGKAGDRRRSGAAGGALPGGSGAGMGMGDSDDHRRDKRQILIYNLKWEAIAELRSAMRHYHMHLPQLRNLMLSYVGSDAKPLRDPGQPVPSPTRGGAPSFDQEPSLATSNGSPIPVAAGSETAAPLLPWLTREQFQSMCDDKFSTEWISKRSANTLFSAFDPLQKDRLWISELITVIHAVDTMRAFHDDEEITRQLSVVWRECANELRRGKPQLAGSIETSHDIEVPVDMLTCLLGTLSTRPMELEIWEKTMKNVFKDIHARHNESKNRHEAYKHHRHHTGATLQLPSIGGGVGTQRRKSQLHQAHNPDAVHGHGKDAHVHGESAHPSIYPSNSPGPSRHTRASSHAHRVADPVAMVDEGTFSRLMEEHPEIIRLYQEQAIQCRRKVDHPEGLGVIRARGTNALGLKLR